MIVCVCLRVSDRDIAQAARGGCTSFERLQQVLGVATRCSRCREQALEVLQLHMQPGAGAAANSACADRASGGGASP
jgi:bacterioferritin-associated ferredoxin